MSYYLSITMLCAAFFMPLGVAAIAAVVKDSVETGVPLWAKILLIVLMLAAAIFFAVMGVYGSEHFDDSGGDFIFYWIFGVIALILAGCWLGSALSET